MAARKKAAHNDLSREKIQTSQLINRLQAYALGTKDPQSKKAVELEAGKIKAIEILLRKTLPDLSQIDGTLNHTVRHEKALDELE
jgi:hypothetical protein